MSFLLGIFGHKSVKTAKLCGVVECIVYERVFYFSFQYIGFVLLVNKYPAPLSISGLLLLPF